MSYVTVSDAIIMIIIVLCHLSNFVEDTSSASALYGTLTGFQWIDTPVCTSNPNSIFNCSRKSLGPYLSQYGHIADLAVECIGRRFMRWLAPNLL